MVESRSPMFPSEENGEAKATARLNGIIASAMDAIISIDQQQNVVLFNPAAEKMFGIRQEEAIGQRINRFIPERFRAARRHIENFGRTGVSNQQMGALGMINGLRANGEEFPIEASISQVEVGGERLFTVILRDVSERARAEAALRKQARLIDLAPVAAIARTLEGTITFWSQGAQALYGWTKEEAIGRRSHDLLRTQFPEDFEKIIADLLQHGRWAGELRQQTKDGRAIIVQSFWLAELKPNGEVEELLESNMDITDAKMLQEHLEDTVKERTAELRETNAELEAFAYSLSHDMRGPLRAISNFTQFVLDDYSRKLGATGTTYLQRVSSAAKRLDRLIQDVLVFTRVSREPARLSEVALEKLVRDIIHERPEFQAPAEIKIEGQLPVVCGHEALLTQIITNLLGNAVKFVEPGVKPRVRVRAEFAGDKVRLWVEDNGIGIHVTAHEKIFGIFHRSHRSEQYEGTGIGLAIVRKAAERMGGRVGVESKPHKGSRFWVELPMPQEQGQLAA